MNTLRALAALAVLLVSGSQAQWNQLTHDGYVSIWSATTSPGAIHMVAFPSGVITSTDGGTVWNPTNAGLPAGTAIESVGYNGTVLFCGTHSGVYRSTNAGSSWTLANTGMPVASSSNFANKFFRSGTATFAIQSAPIGGGAGGVWRTTDNGLTWGSANGGLASNMTVYQIAEIGGVLWAATSAGLASSADQGTLWTVDGASNFTCFAVQGTASRMVIISTFGYRYRNFTTSWQAWQDATGDPANPASGELILYDGKYWASAGTSPSTVLQSTNNGQTWNAYGGGLMGADAIAQYEFHASGNILYLGTLTHLYSHPGTTTSTEEVEVSEWPRPYPTLFSEAFTIDLSSLPSGNQLLLIDAMGREARRMSGLPNERVRIERGTLPSGTYRLMLIDPARGSRAIIGTVVAE